MAGRTIGVNVKVGLRTTRKLGICPVCRSREITLGDTLRESVRLDPGAWRKGKLVVIVPFYCRKCGKQGTTFLTAKGFTSKSTVYITQMVYGKGRRK